MKYIYHCVGTFAEQMASRALEGRSTKHAQQNRDKAYGAVWDDQDMERLQTLSGSRPAAVTELRKLASHLFATTDYTRGADLQQKLDRVYVHGFRLSLADEKKGDGLTPQELLARIKNYTVQRGVVHHASLDWMDQVMVQTEECMALCKALVYRQFARLVKRLKDERVSVPDFMQEGPYVPSTMFVSDAMRCPEDVLKGRLVSQVLVPGADGRQTWHEVTCVGLVDAMRYRPISIERFERGAVLDSPLLAACQYSCAFAIATLRPYGIRIDRGDGHDDEIVVSFNGVGAHSLPAMVGAKASASGRYSEKQRGPHFLSIFAFDLADIRNDKNVPVPTLGGHPTALQLLFTTRFLRCVDSLLASCKLCANSEDAREVLFMASIVVRGVQQLRAHNAEAPNQLKARRTKVDTQAKAFGDLVARLVCKHVKAGLFGRNEDAFSYETASGICRGDAAFAASANTVFRLFAGPDSIAQQQHFDAACNEFREHDRELASTYGVADGADENSLNVQIYKECVQGYMALFFSRRYVRARDDSIQERNAETELYETVDNLRRVRGVAQAVPYAEGAHCRKRQW